MNVPPIRITYRNVPPSTAIEVAIQKQLPKIWKHYHRISDCHVVLETPHSRHRKGKHYRVRITLHVPGEELVVSRNPSQHDAHEDFYTALREAVRASKRQLQDYVRRHREPVKQPTNSSRKKSQTAA